MIAERPEFMQRKTYTKREDERHNRRSQVPYAEDIGKKIEEYDIGAK
jgi:hypothetical protein